jgi:hypothetical protein
VRREGRRFGWGNLREWGGQDQIRLGQTGDNERGGAWSATLHATGHVRGWPRRHSASTSERIDTARGHPHVDAGTTQWH